MEEGRIVMSRREQDVLKVMGRGLPGSGRKGGRGGPAPNGVNSVDIPARRQ